MLLLTKHDVQKAITMKEAVDIVEKAFSAFSAGRAAVPIRTQVDVEAKDAVALFMPGFVEDLGALGLKIVSVFPQNPSRGLPTICSLVVLNDPETGEPAAAMEGSWLTALRTGAASGVATRHLARTDAARVAIIGTGIQARTQLEAVLCERNIRRVDVYDLDPERARLFIEEMQKSHKDSNLEFTASKSPGEAVENADIICTATTSKNPVFPGNKIKKGVHINAVGAFTPQMQEIGEDVLVRATKVVVDSVTAAMHEAGDLIIPINKGLFRAEDIHGEIGEISGGIKKGRETPEEITLFKTVGLSVQDMAVGIYVLEQARKLGLGLEFDFNA
jgi:alanine dehydrogenase